VIQSLAAGDIVNQSLVEDADDDVVDVDAESLPAAGFASAAGADFESGATPSADSFVTGSFEEAASSAGFDALEAEPRSFFAQPVPLKWIAGVVKPFVIVPSSPHSGQKRGPCSWIPWITSVRWRQAEQV
jgi:hypothetical protein